MVIGCGSNDDEPKLQARSNGLFFFGKDSNFGWVRNDNSQPVTLRAVALHRAEFTRWVAALAPGERHELDTRRLGGMYIYSVDGSLQGYIRFYDGLDWH